jgi:DNA polymerase-3 subunit epsilon
VKLAGWWPRRGALDGTRWVMVDVEASSLDAAGARLLSVGAVALRIDWATRKLSIPFGDSFEVVLRQEQASDHDNILVHGIGAAQQAQGAPVRPALEAFAAFVGSSPLLAFHAGFDRAVLERGMAQAGLAPAATQWLDVEDLCAVAYPGSKARSLDDWMAQLGVRCLARHLAVADALVQAELLLKVWPRLAGECAGWSDVRRLAGRRRWLAGT